MQQLSYSQLWAYWTCPRLSDYLNQPTLRLAPSRTQEASQLGAWVHKTLHQACLHADAETLPEVRALKADYPQIWSGYQEVIQTQPAQAKVYSEWEIAVPLPVEWGLPYLVTGRLDRLWVKDSHCRILDWKTGQGKDCDGTRFQLRFYAWLVAFGHQALNLACVESVQAEAHFLKTGDSTSLTLQTNMLASETDFFRALIQGYDAQRHQELHGIPDPRSTSEGPWCTMCEYQRLCPEGRYHAQ